MKAEAPTATGGPLSCSVAFGSPLCMEWRRVGVGEGLGDDVPLR